MTLDMLVMQAQRVFGGEVREEDFLVGFGTVTHVDDYSCDDGVLVFDPNDRAVMLDPLTTYSVKRGVNV